MIHIAGPWLNPNDDLLIQRCAACGFSLIDCRIKGMATAEPGNADIATWAFGDLVQVEGNGSPPNTSGSETWMTTQKEAGPKFQACASLKGCEAEQQKKPVVIDAGFLVLF